jgi:hypothetical protein
MDTILYAISSRFHGCSHNELHSKTAILPQKPLRQFHFQFGPSAREKHFVKKNAANGTQVQTAARAAKFFLRALALRACAHLVCKAFVIRL